MHTKTLSTAESKWFTQGLSLDRPSARSLISILASTAKNLAQTAFKHKSIALRTALLDGITEIHAAKSEQEEITNQETEKQTIQSLQTAERLNTLIQSMQSYLDSKPPALVFSFKPKTYLVMLGIILTASGLFIAGYFYTHILNFLHLSGLKSLYAAGHIIVPKAVLIACGFGAACGLIAFTCLYLMQIVLAFRSKRRQQAAWTQCKTATRTWVAQAKKTVASKLESGIPVLTSAVMKAQQVTNKADAEIKQLQSQLRLYKLPEKIELYLQQQIRQLRAPSTQTEISLQLPITLDYNSCLKGLNSARPQPEARDTIFPTREAAHDAKHQLAGIKYIHGERSGDITVQLLFPQAELDKTLDQREVATLCYVQVTLNESNLPKITYEATALYNKETQAYNQVCLNPKHKKPNPLSLQSADGAVTYTINFDQLPDAHTATVQRNIDDDSAARTLRRTHIFECNKGKWTLSKKEGACTQTALAKALATAEQSKQSAIQTVLSYNILIARYKALQSSLPQEATSTQQATSVAGTPPLPADELASQHSRKMTVPDAEPQVAVGPGGTGLIV